MKNIHTTLPPNYRTLWKEFEALKKEDIKDGRAWLYDADPFATFKEREASKAAAEKKRKEGERVKEKARGLPDAAGVVLRGGGPVSRGNQMKWGTTVHKVELGRRVRTSIEGLLRARTIWNPHKIKISAEQKKCIINELVEAGFRESHVEEAVDECKDREETLEWLLIHVPEDDLPGWALPESYAAGVSVAATDLKREGAIQRLSASGYSADLCREVYDDQGGDEGKAAEVLQHVLMHGGRSPKASEMPRANIEKGILNGAEECWDQEMESLESVFGERFSRSSKHVCRVELTEVINVPSKNVKAAVQIRKPPHYPAEIIVGIVADLPKYIKLSIIKKTLEYMEESLKSEDMKMFFVLDWIQQNINDIIERPGALRKISTVASAASENPSRTPWFQRREPRHPKPITWEPDPKVTKEWKRRQQTPIQRNFIAQRQKLPAWHVQQKMLDAVNTHQVTIILGETGSGKSTQSVQFILDDLFSKGLGNKANIIVTQPRRISALGLADRVAEERCSPVGKEVGYSIRGETRTGPNTKITFVTTGVLLRRFQTSGGRIDHLVSSLADVSHVVVDEVHERSLDTDFLLTIMRDVLGKSKGLKLVLMSATLDVSRFKDYFVADGISVGSVEISGRTYPVQDHYLEDIIPWTGFTPEHEVFDENVQVPSDTKSKGVGKVIGRLGGRVNYTLITETVKAIHADLGSKAGGILIFLPGVAEIMRECSLLRSMNSLHVLPLHASLEMKEQRRVFEPPPSGKRKVIVATNVAETSITIDDIVAVIDTGKVKETSFDPSKNMRNLSETWASQAACKQRRGRAGRVGPGNCYKLYSRNLEMQMPERPEPEIRRVPLEQLCLSVRAMGIGDVSNFLARAPTPPESTAVEGAITLLQRMGALDGEGLTALGSQLAIIPADLRCGKLMIYGAMFGCLDECVTMSAILSTKSPFVSPQEKREEAKQARMRFSRGNGDLLADLRAFQTWEDMVYNNRASMREIQAFCDSNFLSRQTLNDISATRMQHYSALTEIGITRPSTDMRSDSTSSSLTTSPMSRTMMLRALTASAFTPQISRIQFPDKKFFSSMSGAVELDPEAKTIRYFDERNGRVFLHPSSTLFDAQGFSGNAAFLSYFSVISTSKIFVRELTRKFAAYPSFSLLILRFFLTMSAVETAFTKSANFFLATLPSFQRILPSPIRGSH